MVSITNSSNRLLINSIKDSKQSLDDRFLWRVSESNRGSKRDREKCVMRKFMICTLAIYRTIKLREGRVGRRGGEKCK